MTVVKIQMFILKQEKHYKKNKSILIKILILKRRNNQ